MPKAKRGGPAPFFPTLPKFKGSKWVYPVIAALMIGGLGLLVRWMYTS